MKRVEEAPPERIWLTKFLDEQEPRFLMVNWRTPTTYLATRSHQKVAYVPESTVDSLRAEVERLKGLSTDQTNIEMSLRAELAKKEAKIQRLHDEIAELAHTVSTHSDKIAGFTNGDLVRRVDAVRVVGMFISPSPLSNSSMTSTLNAVIAELKNLPALEAARHTETVSKER